MYITKMKGKFLNLSLYDNGSVCGQLITSSGVILAEVTKDATPLFFEEEDYGKIMVLPKSTYAEMILHILKQRSMLNMYLAENDHYVVFLKESVGVIEKMKRKEGMHYARLEFSF